MKNETIDTHVFRTIVLLGTKPAFQQQMWYLTFFVWTLYFLSFWLLLYGIFNVVPKEAMKNETIDTHVFRTIVVLGTKPAFQQQMWYSNITFFRFWSYVVKVVQETRRDHQMLYFCLYYYHWVDTSAGGLLVQDGIMLPVVSASALTWFIIHIYCQLIMSPPTFVGRHIVFVLSVCSSVCLSQFVSATPLKLLNRMSWNLVDSKDTICSCAYYQEILIAWILWELCPFELRNFPKCTTEAACQRNSSETTEQNFMKHGKW
jgi:hypothetical protein